MFFTALVDLTLIGGALSVVVETVVVGVGVVVDVVVVVVGVVEIGRASCRERV